MSRHEALLAAGWTRQATYDEPRLSEMAATYEELGFEVRLEPFEATDESACSVCLREQPERFKTLYTRKREAEENAPKEESP